MVLGLLSMNFCRHQQNKWLPWPKFLDDPIQVNGKDFGVGGVGPGAVVRNIEHAPSLCPISSFVKLCLRQGYHKADDNRISKKVKPEDPQHQMAL
jgi:hypothetical protein